jgi:hypothetical protein
MITKCLVTLVLVMWTGMEPALVFAAAQLAFSGVVLLGYARYGLQLWLQVGLGHITGAASVCTGSIMQYYYTSGRGGCAAGLCSIRPAAVAAGGFECWCIHLDSLQGRVPILYGRLPHGQNSGRHGLKVQPPS